MPEIPSLLDLLKSGVHFGHQVSRRHPKMAPYIFTHKSGVHIINMEKTQLMLGGALEFVRKTVANGGTMLFVGSKEQARSIVKKYATECGMPYVTERWLGGTFTNFGEIRRVLQRFSELKHQRTTGQLERYTKKERLEIDREISRLERMVGGIEGMGKLPEAIYVVDVKHEKIAVSEAHQKNVPVVALCDTNINPTQVSYVIPANDDAIKSIDLITRLVSAAVQEGRKDREAKLERSAAESITSATPAELPANA